MNMRFCFARSATLLGLIASLGIVAIPGVSFAETPEVRMDRLLATYPQYADPKTRADGLARILGLWHQVKDCVEATDIFVSDLSVCVARVHKQCVDSLGGSGIDHDQRACWTDEYFAWLLLRSDSLEELIADVKKGAEAYPEFYPKGNGAGDYSVEHAVKTLRLFDAEIDKIGELSCASEVAVQGFDPMRDTIPILAINSTFSCEIEWQAEAVWRYLRWQKF